jgi:hypothetical protein
MKYMLQIPFITGRRQSELDLIEPVTLDRVVARSAPRL